MRSRNVIELDSYYWLGDFYENDGWKRLTLFHKVTNLQGGSLNTPVAEIDIIEHPSMDGCNKHCEIKISIRNDLKRQGYNILVDENSKVLRHPSDVIDPTIIRTTVEKIKEEGMVSSPLSIYVCIRHVEDFRVEGDFWSED